MKILWVSLAIGVATGALAAPTAVHAVSAQHIENTSEICIQETARVERTTGIPKALLGAISLAETGRWAPDRQESFAWPWTVMAEGRGRYFDTKAEAVAEVYALLDQGLTNIDVGCMQINLHYHGGAFADIEQAMDPTANIAYAGRYLSNLYGAAKSWTTAAGYYHSMTPDRSNAYRERVLALWNGMEKALSPTAHSISRRGSTGPLRTRVLPRTPWVSRDMARIAKLNAQFRLAREAETKADFASQRRDDLAFWRESRAAGVTKNHVALMRRAQADAAHRRKYSGLNQNRTTRFANKRHDQLRRWRLSKKNRADAS